MQRVTGDLIKLALTGEFDVIVHRGEIEPAIAAAPRGQGQAVVVLPAL